MPSILDLAAATVCHGCGARGPSLCERCFRSLPLVAGEEQMGGAGRALFAWHYVGVPRSLILALKLRGRRDCSVPLARGLVGTVRRRGVLGSAVTWVPARTADVLRRGFDHAEVLARSFAAHTGLPVRGMLGRASPSRDQSCLSREERARNLEGAFAPCGPIPRNVILVDDLITSGATAAACAEALLRGGAGAVEVVCACRA